jgi:hypothetical protein
MSTPAAFCPVLAVAAEGDGTYFSAAITGLGEPEYLRFAAIVTLPSVLKDASLKGPSTTDHSGLDAYPATSLACAVRNLYTALHLAHLSAALSVPQPPLPGGAAALVTSQAMGNGVIWASSL